MKQVLIAVVLVLILSGVVWSQDTNATYTNSVVGNGTIDSTGVFTLVVTGSAGDSADTYVIAADSAYFIDSVLLDGVNIGRVYTYETGVLGAGDTTDHTIVAYFGASENPITPTWAYAGIRIDPGGQRFVNVYTTPSYLAYDSLYFVSPTLQSDIGGRPIYAGVDIEAMTDTITDPKFVLEGSVDNVLWFGVDSLTVTTPELVGQYRFMADLTNHRLAYWRVRFGIDNALWNGVAAPTVPGRFHFWIHTNFDERF